MAPRVTYRRTTGYNTRSNKIRMIRTPGGKLLAQHTIKKASRPRCADCPRPISGVPALRPTGYRALARSARSVTRPYGGNLCGVCVRERITRAFLIEEVKIVKKVVNQKKK